MNLEARVRELEAALEKYGAHLKSCNLAFPKLAVRGCDCGLDAELERAKAKR